MGLAGVLHLAGGSIPPFTCLGELVDGELQEAGGRRAHGQHTQSDAAHQVCVRGEVVLR